VLDEPNGLDIQAASSCLKRSLRAWPSPAQPCCGDTTNSMQSSRKSVAACCCGKGRAEDGPVSCELLQDGPASAPLFARPCKVLHSGGYHQVLAGGGSS